MSFNRVTLLGNVGAVDLRHTQSSAVLNVRLATSESYLDSNKQRQERTDWHTVTIWGKRGEALANILAKGSRILVEGSLRTSTYDDRDGNKRSKTEVFASNVVLCGGGERQGGERRRPQDNALDSDHLDAINEDDLPF